MEMAMTMTMDIGIGLSGYRCILTRGNSWSTTSMCGGCGPDFLPSRNCDTFLRVLDQFCCRPLSRMVKEADKLGL